MRPLPTDNFQIPDIDEYMSYHEFAKERITSVFPGFCNNAHDYYKKRQAGWKTCDEKEKKSQYFLMKGEAGTPTENIQTTTFHVQLLDMVVISPKGTKKTFNNFIRIVHLDPTFRATLTLDLMIDFMRDDRFQMGRTFVHYEDCPCCRAERERKKTEQKTEDPIPLTKVEEMD